MVSVCAVNYMYLHVDAICIHYLVPLQVDYALDMFKQLHADEAEPEGDERFVIPYTSKFSRCVIFTVFVGS